MHGPIYKYCLRIVFAFWLDWLIDTICRSLLCGCSFPDSSFSAMIWLYHFLSFFLLPFGHKKIGAALYKNSSGCFSGISDHSTDIYHMVLVYVMLSCYQDSESFTTSVWPMHVASTQFYCVHFWPLHYIRIYRSIIAALRLMNNIWFKGRGVQSRRMFISTV